MNAMIANTLLIAMTIWLANILVSWVGVVRHAYRIYRAHAELADIIASHENGLVRYAAEGALMNEWYRLFLKCGLCLYGALTIWRFVDRIAETSWLLDWRDIAGPLSYLAVITLLTVWSEHECRRRPHRAADVVVEGADGGS